MHILTPKELKQLSGLDPANKDELARLNHWLRSHGFVYIPGADGIPRVLEKHVEQMLTHKEDRIKNNTKLPNFAALRIATSNG
jgi:hypothetical protein